MWHAAFHDGEPEPEFPRRLNPPENELPVPLPQNRVLVRTDDVAVAISGLQAYTTGVSFQVAARARPGVTLPGLDRGLGDVFWEHRPGSPRFLFGVEFTDGRRASSQPVPGASGDIVFHQGGGGGGETSVDQSWWLSPLPPDGPLRVVARCPEIGLPETVVELDGTAIRQAGEGATVLWPWEPPRDRGPEPPPPPADLPADSWFAR
jgi:hypothetical protein